VAGVQADAHAALVCDAVQNVAQLLECVAHAAPLPRYDISRALSWAMWLI
jgi:hypothetical protein